VPGKQSKAAIAPFGIILRRDKKEVCLHQRRVEIRLADPLPLTVCRSKIAAVIAFFRHLTVSAMIRRYLFVLCLILVLSVAAAKVALVTFMPSTWMFGIYNFARKFFWGLLPGQWHEPTAPNIVLLYVPKKHSYQVSLLCLR
jgi:hypothetical protein